MSANPGAAPCELFEKAGKLELVRGSGTTAVQENGREAFRRGRLCARCERCENPFLMIFGKPSVLRIPGCPPHSHSQDFGAVRRKKLSQRPQRGQRSPIQSPRSGEPNPGQPEFLSFLRVCLCALRVLCGDPLLCVLFSPLRTPTPTSLAPPFPPATLHITK